MVYCVKCGAKNEDDAVVCVKCGASLQTGAYLSRRYERRHAEEECFGIPRGGAVVGLIFGVIIVVFGLTLFLNRVYGWSIDIWGIMWPLIVIIFGILVLLGALYRFRRRY